MAQEVELKLELSTDDISAFLSLDWFHSLKSLTQRPTKTLENTYFDTPSLELLKSRTALRIRKSDDQYFQTLKTKGQSVGGLHQRGEWEYPIEVSVSDDLIKQALQPESFPADVWPLGLKLETLEPIFETNFTRYCWHWHSSCGSVVEVVLDLGRVVSGVNCTELSEIEMELIEGKPSCLFDLAEALCRDVTLQISDVTKAQRGFDLYRPGSWQVDAPELSESSCISDRFQAALVWIREGHAVNDESIAELLDSLIQEGVLPKMDVDPWLLQGKPSTLSSKHRSQWLLRLARHAWLETQSAP
jgi:triphosphatase